MEDGKDWFQRAHCRGLDPEIFHPPQGYGKGDEARSHCSLCPVAVECLDWSLNYSNGINQGIWGGLSQNERKILRRRLRSNRSWGVFKCSKCLYLRVMLDSDEICELCKKYV